MGKAKLSIRYISVEAVGSPSTVAVAVAGVAAALAEAAASAFPPALPVPVAEAQPKLRHKASFRARCAVCGQEDVAHDSTGTPYASHRNGRRHREAKR